MIEGQWQRFSVTSHDDDYLNLGKARKYNDF